MSHTVEKYAHRHFSHYWNANQCKDCQKNWNEKYVFEKWKLN